MRPLKTFTVSPAAPDELAPLVELAYNLRWSWHSEVQNLFARMDTDAWEATNHNPVAMLGRMDRQRLKDLSVDKHFLDEVRRLWDELKSYLEQGGWWTKTHGRKYGGATPLAAYFCAEYGLVDCMPLYAGGLGVLAGDYLKSASDMDIPIVSVGLLYQQGYLRQRLNADGWQMELFPLNDFYNLPIELVRDDEGAVVRVHVPMPQRNVTVQVWRVRVGRVDLYMLDTNLPENPPPYRHITGQLYGGDREMRIRQEIVLGLGGIRMLEGLGIRPASFHINEGHSAFLALERIRSLMSGEGLSFEQARQAVSASNIFTTHTPVPAGNDAFEPWLIDKYFSNYWPRLGLDRNAFFALGRQDPSNHDEPMSLTVLAMKLSEFRNGVSELHGQVSRRLWSGIWPGAPEEESPITSITDGIHTRNWISPEMCHLLGEHLGDGWHSTPPDEKTWEALEGVDDAELWRIHQRNRRRLVEFARRRLRDQLVLRGAGKSESLDAGKVLDPEALTIVFARRFATYKRANLVLQDTDRLAKILNDRQRPVQLIFAGKGHPMDKAGKELIRRIIHVARQAPFRRSMVFIEDYDMNIARRLVQGCDVWLNTPLRPMEASGTSGMKAAANGGLNLSVLDGWWAEGYQPDVGWAIGGDENYHDLDYQNSVESQTLYDLLEHEVVPLFYDRGEDNLPVKWISMMKRAMSKLAPRFSINRMILQYAEEFYAPAAKLWEDLSANGFSSACELARKKCRLADNFKKITIESVSDNMNSSPDGAPVGKNLLVEAVVNLHHIGTEEVQVELYYGSLDENEQFTSGQATPMEKVENLGEGRIRCRAQITCRRSGRLGYTVRVVGRHLLFENKTDVSLLRWA